MVGEETITNTVGNLPGDIADKLNFLLTMIKAIGGVLTLYLIWIIYNFIQSRKRYKKIREIHDDIEKIKNKLNIKNKK